MVEHIPAELVCSLEFGPTLQIVPLGLRDVGRERDARLLYQQTTDVLRALDSDNQQRREKHKQQQQQQQQQSQHSLMQTDDDDNNSEDRKASVALETRALLWNFTKPPLATRIDSDWLPLLNKKQWSDAMLDLFSRWLSIGGRVCCRAIMAMTQPRKAIQSMADAGTRRHPKQGVLLRYTTCQTWQERWEGNWKDAAATMRAPNVQEWREKLFEAETVPLLRTMDRARTLRYQDVRYVWALTGDAGDELIVECDMQTRVCHTYAFGNLKRTSGYHPGVRGVMLWLRMCFPQAVPNSPPYEHKQRLSPGEEFPDWRFIPDTVPIDDDESQPEQQQQQQLESTDGKAEKKEDEEEAAPAATGSTIIRNPLRWTYCLMYLQHRVIDGLNVPHMLGATTLDAFWQTVVSMSDLMLVALFRFLASTYLDANDPWRSVREFQNALRQDLTKVELAPHYPVRPDKLDRQLQDRAIRESIRQCGLALEHLSAFGDPKQNWDGRVFKHTIEFLQKHLGDIHIQDSLIRNVFRHYRTRLLHNATAAVEPLVRNTRFSPFQLFREDELKERLYNSKEYDPWQGWLENPRDESKDNGTVWTVSFGEYLPHGKPDRDNGRLVIMRTWKKVLASTTINPETKASSYASWVEEEETRHKVEEQLRHECFMGSTLNLLRPFVPNYALCFTPTPLYFREVLNSSVSTYVATLTDAHNVHIQTAGPLKCFQNAFGVAVMQTQPTEHVMYEYVHGDKLEDRIGGTVSAQFAPDLVLRPTELFSICLQLLFAQATAEKLVGLQNDGFERRHVILRRIPITTSEMWASYWFQGTEYHVRLPVVTVEEKKTQHDSDTLMETTENGSGSSAAASGKDEKKSEPQHESKKQYFGLVATIVNYAKTSCVHSGVTLARTDLAPRDKTSNFWETRAIESIVVSGMAKCKQLESGNPLGTSKYDDFFDRKLLAYIRTEREKKPLTMTQLLEWLVFFFFPPQDEMPEPNFEQTVRDLPQWFSMDTPTVDSSRCVLTRFGIRSAASEYARIDRTVLDSLFRESSDFPSHWFDANTAKHENKVEQLLTGLPDFKSGFEAKEIALTFGAPLAQAFKKNRAATTFLVQRVLERLSHKVKSLVITEECVEFAFHNTDVWLTLVGRCVLIQDLIITMDVRQYEYAGTQYSLHALPWWKRMRAFRLVAPGVELAPSLVMCLPEELRQFEFDMAGSPTMVQQLKRVFPGCQLIQLAMSPPSVVAMDETGDVKSLPAAARESDAAVAVPSKLVSVCMFWKRQKRKGKQVEEKEEEEEEEEDKAARKRQYVQGMVYVMYTFIKNGWMDAGWDLRIYCDDDSVRQQWKPLTKWENIWKRMQTIASNSHERIRIVPFPSWLDTYRSAENNKTLPELVGTLARFDAIAQNSTLKRYDVVAVRDIEVGLDKQDFKLTEAYANDRDSKPMHHFIFKGQEDKHPIIAGMFTVKHGAFLTIQRITHWLSDRHQKHGDRAFEYGVDQDFLRDVLGNVDSDTETTTYFRKNKDNTMQRWQTQAGEWIFSDYPQQATAANAYNNILSWLNKTRKALNAATVSVAESESITAAAQGEDDDDDDKKNETEDQDMEDKEKMSDGSSSSPRLRRSDSPPLSLSTTNETDEEMKVKPQTLSSDTRSSKPSSNVATSQGPTPPFPAPATIEKHKLGIYTIVRGAVTAQELQDVYLPTGALISTGRSTTRTLRAPSEEQVWMGQKSIDTLLRKKRMVPRGNSQKRWEWKFGTTGGWDKPQKDFMVAKLLGMFDLIKDVMGMKEARGDRETLLNKWLKGVFIMYIQPGAEHQDWHTDSDKNARQYLTVAMPLQDYDGKEKTGGTQFKDASRRTGKSIPKLRAGDVLLFDGSRKHRGTTNHSQTKPRLFVYAALSTAAEDDNG